MNKRNYYVDILRYFLALDVVFIHQHPLQDFSFNFGYFITVIMPRLANPLFFMISGYYFINKLLEQHGKGVYLKYIYKTIKPFFLWSIIYFIYDHKDALNFDLNTFITYITHSSGNSFHLWFILALLKALTIVTLLYKIKCFNISIYLAVFIWVIGVLGNSYSFITTQIPVLESLGSIIGEHMALPFTIFGYYAGRMNEKWKYKRKRLVLIALFLVISILAIFEINLLLKVNVNGNFNNPFGPYILSILLFLIVLNIPNKGNYLIKSISTKCKVASIYIYYSHVLVIHLFDYINVNVLNSRLNSLERYVSIILIITIISIIVNYILNVIKTFLQKNSAGGNVKEYYIGRIKVLAMERLHRS